jgi:transposase
MAMSEQVKCRVRAGRMLLKEIPVTRISAELGVSRQTVYNWKAILEEQGLDGLRAVNPGGRPSQLSSEELETIRTVLLGGATAQGFGSDLWTLKRVRQLIDRQFGILYSEVHVWRLLGKLGFSSQKPERRALERNEAAIERWKRRRWPELKKKLSAKGVS